MTLNISIVSRAGIHQSADFRISKTERDINGNWIELQPNSSKIVPLRYEKWLALLTYCGMGLWKGKRTDEYAAEWLADLSNSGATFQDAVEKIRQRGTAWIASINQSLGRQVHSFILAGYEGGIPIYAIVSNYETLTGSITPISDELKVDIRLLTTGVHVFVTGIRNAVPNAVRRRLKHLVHIGTDANVIRYELAETNRLAAQSPAAQNGISAACLTYSLDKHGGSSGVVHGDVPGPLMPRRVVSGVDITKFTAQMFPNAKFVQDADATSQSNVATIREHIDCKLRFNKARQEPDGELVTVEEVGAINDYHLSMRGLNDKGWIVGQSRNPLEAPPHAFAWPLGQAIRDLGTFGGPHSNAFCVNDSNQVVGQADTHQPMASHGFLWDESEGMRDLGTLGGRNSLARSINNACQIVGSSYVGAGEPKEEAERAFLWTSAGGMTNLGDQFDGWSRAVAINNAGVVLGWRLRRGVRCGFIWSSEFGVFDILGEEGREFFPRAINDAGLVVGEGDDSSGKRRAYSWTREVGLKQLAVADDFHPFDVDVYGTVVGNVFSRPWNRPYLYRIGTSEFLALPFVEEHHTSVEAINRSGVIVGAASTGSWEHSHPLIWHTYSQKVETPR